MKRKFLLCKTCGNLVEILEDAGVDIVCCGLPMEELVANTADAAAEKHIPVISIEENDVTVKVGDVLHPMSEDHYIKWIYLETDKGIHRVNLRPEDEPYTTFALRTDETIKGAYAYCNLHGLWKKEL